jgi:hypothetical protein
VRNAWSAIYARKHSKIFKANRKTHLVEEYLNSPKDTAPNELEINIHFGIK